MVLQSTLTRKRKSGSDENVDRVWGSYQQDLVQVSVWKSQLEKRMENVMQYMLDSSHGQSTFLDHGAQLTTPECNIHMESKKTPKSQGNFEKKE